MILDIAPLKSHSDRPNIDSLSLELMLSPQIKQVIPECAISFEMIAFFGVEVSIIQVLHASREPIAEETLCLL